MLTDREKINLKKLKEKYSQDAIMKFSAEEYQWNQSLLQKLERSKVIRSQGETMDGTQYFELMGNLDLFEEIEKEDEDAYQKVDLSGHKQVKKYDVFISHANADKSDYVESLYKAIKKLGVNIFYDTEVLSWGADNKRVILDGTEKSEFAIIVISENFFGREWTERELNEFLKRQNATGQKIILPLLHNITLEKLKEQYPILGNIQAISTKDYSEEQIAILFAKEMIKRLKGQIL